MPSAGLKSEAADRPRALPGRPHGEGTVDLDEASGDGVGLAAQRDHGSRGAIEAALHGQRGRGEGEVERDLREHVGAAPGGPRLEAVDVRLGDKTGESLIEQVI